MSTTFGEYGPALPRLAKLGERMARPLYRHLFKARHFYQDDSRRAEAARRSAAEKLRRGESIYVLGLMSAGHNSGVALAQASLEEGTRLLCNEEEERFTGVKHLRWVPKPQPGCSTRATQELRPGCRQSGCGCRRLELPGVPGGRRAFAAGTRPEELCVSAERLVRGI